MTKRIGVVSAIATFAQVLVLALIISLTNSHARAGATGSIDITGTVTNSSDGDVEGASVYATDPGTDTVDFGPVTTDSSGYYDLQVSAGTYDFHYDPPSGSGLTPVVESDVTVLSDQTINVQYAPLTYTFSGTLKDSTGTALPDMKVALNDGGTTVGSTNTGSDGSFSMSVVPGTYTLVVYNNGGQEVGNMNEVSMSQNSPGIDMESGDVSQNLVLDTTDVHVTVEDSDSNPLSGVTVNAGYGSNSGALSLYTGDGGENAETQNVTQTTGSDGTATFTSVVGITYGASTPSAGSICADISGSNICLADSLTVSGETTIVIQLLTNPEPSAPVDLTATTPTNTAPVLNWTAGSTSSNPAAASYNIYRNGTDVGISDTTTFTDTDAPQGTNAYYVTAVSSGGYESADSNTVNVAYDSTLPAISYFDSNNGATFSRQTTPPTTGVSTQTINSDGSVTVAVNDASGYADSGMVLYETTLGDLPNFTVNSSSGNFGLNLWFDNASLGDFFQWSDGVMTGTGGDTYGLSSGSTDGTLSVSGDTSFFMMDDGQSYTLSQLIAGDDTTDGVNADTPVAIWVGVDVGSGGSTSATISSIEGL